jgi:hypothetical protein
MKALSVHGDGDSSARTSRSVGSRGQYGPIGIERLTDLEVGKSDDMKPSSSASQSERTEEQRGDAQVFYGGVCLYHH